MQELLKMLLGLAAACGAQTLTAPVATMTEGPAVVASVESSLVPTAETGLAPGTAVQPSLSGSLELGTSPALTNIGTAGPAAQGAHRVPTAIVPRAERAVLGGLSDMLGRPVPIRVTRRMALRSDSWNYAEDPEAPKAGAPAQTERRPLTARAWNLLGRIVNPFGGRKTAEPVPVERDPYAEVGPAVLAEIDGMKTLKTRAEVQAYLRKTGDEIVARIKRSRGTDDIGLHYNLHGGSKKGYIEGGGIHAARGDIALQHSMYGGDPNYKVYFFQSKERNLYDILNESDPGQLLFPSRMGSVLIVFAVDSPAMKEAFAGGGAVRRTSISIDFEPDWFQKNGKRLMGVPYEAFLAPPLEVFGGVRRRIGSPRRLTRDEETLAVMRAVEKAVISP